LAHVSLDHDPPSPKLRVVYLDHVALLSGGELALVRLLQALPNVEAHVILAEDGPLVDRLKREGISVEVMAMRERTRRLRKESVQPRRLPLGAVSDTLVYTMRLARRLRTLRPDVVHTNSLKSGIYGSMAARLVGVPLVWHLRDRMDTEYLPRLGVLLVRILARHLPNVVISNSQVTRQTLRRRERSLVIASLAELASPRGEPRSQAGPLVVGIVGRLAPWKGQDVFLRAFAEAFPNGEERAIVVGAPLFGQAEIAFANALRRLSQELNLGSRVEFRGHREDVAAELRTIDILVHASTTPEPFGQVVIEGMSAQIPVVATRGGGPEEIISDGVDGMLYPLGDVAALAHILVRLGAEPQLRARLGCAAARRARDFSGDSIARQTMVAYGLAREDASRHSELAPHRRLPSRQLR
jgi:glycosyltransferase involved in cell wall biosynthesis